MTALLAPDPPAAKRRRGNPQNLSAYAFKKGSAAAAAGRKGAAAAYARRKRLELAAALVFSQEATDIAALHHASLNFTLQTIDAKLAAEVSRTTPRCKYLSQLTEVSGQVAKLLGIDNKSTRERSGGLAPARRPDPEPTLATSPAMTTPPSVTPDTQAPESPELESAPID